MMLVVTEYDTENMLKDTANKFTVSTGASMYLSPHMVRYPDLYVHRSAAYSPGRRYVYIMMYNVSSSKLASSLTVQSSSL